MSISRCGAMALTLSDCCILCWTATFGKQNRLQSPLFFSASSTLVVCRLQSLWQLAYISSMRRRRAWAELSLLGESENEKIGNYSVYFFNFFILSLIVMGDTPLFKG